MEAEPVRAIEQIIVATPPIRRRQSPRLLIGLGGLAAAILLATIIVVIKNRQGEVVGKVEVPDGTSVVVLKDGKEVATTDAPKKEPTAEPPAPPPPADTSTTKAATPPSPTFTPPTSPATLPPLPDKTGEPTPIVPAALVAHPPKLNGLSSWTIETIAPRGVVRQLAFHPKKPLLAIFSTDEVIRLWDTDKQELVRIILDPHGARSFAWSPDGNALAIGTNDGFVNLWDVEDAKLVRQLDRQKGPVLSLAWKPDGSKLATGGEDKRVRIWEVATGDLLETLTDQDQTDHDAVVSPLVWTPDGKWIVSNRCVWNAENGAWERNHDGNMARIACSPDSRFLVTVNSRSDGKIELRDVQSDDAKPFFREGAWLNDVQWSPNGRFLAEGFGAELRVWEVANRKELLKREIGTRWISWSEDSKTLAVAGDGGTLEILNIESGKTTKLPIARHSGEAVGLAWSPDGKLVAVKGDQLVLWDATTLAQLSEFEANRHSQAIAFSVDGTYLAWARHSGAAVLRIGERTARQLDHPGTVLNLSWSPDSSILATVDGGPSGEAYLWHPRALNLVGELQGQDKAPRDRVEWSPTGALIAVGTNGKIDIFDSKSRELVATANGSVNSFKFSLDGTELIGVGLTTWSAQTGELVRPARQTAFTSALALARNRQWIASADAPAAINVWPLIGGASIRRFGGKTIGAGNLNSLAWSPDSRLLASVQWEGVVLVWDVETGRRQISLVPLRHTQRSLAISGDGHYRGSARVEKDIVYIANTTDGKQLTLSPDEFAKQFGWRNDPEKVRLLEAAE